MSDLLAQIVLARRDVDGEGWMNILVVIVMIVFWTVAAIVKSMKTKSDEQKQPSRVPSPKTPVRGRATGQQRLGQANRPAGHPQHPEHPPATQKKNTTLADLRAAARKFATDAEQIFQPPSTRPRPESLPASPKPHAGPGMAPTPQPVARPPQDMAALQTAAADHTLDRSDILSDYADRESLRKAILHCEILGPPLALRD